MRVARHARGTVVRHGARGTVRGSDVRLRVPPMFGSEIPRTMCVALMPGFEGQLLSSAL